VHPRKIIAIVAAAVLTPSCLPAQDWFAAKGHPDGTVHNLCFSPDGARLITVSRRSLVAWDLKTKERLRTFPFDGVFPGSVAFLADGHRFLYGASNLAFVDRAATGWRVFECDMDSGSARLLASSSANETLVGLLEKRDLVIVKEAQNYRLLSLKTKKEVGSLSRPGRLQSLAFSPDQSLWVLQEGETRTGQEPEGAIVVVELPSLRRVARFSVPERGEGCLITPDNKWVLTGSTVFQQTLYAWEIPSGRNVLTLKVRGLRGALGDISVNGRIAAVFSRLHGDVYFIDLLGKKYAGRQAFYGQFHCLKFAPDGRNYAVGDEGWVRTFHTREAVLKAATER
jgi:WD40 repeat protein